MNTRGRKQKGRSLVLEVKAWLHEKFPSLKDDDIIVPATSVPGEDLNLSPVAREVFPYSVECKRQEGLTKIYNFMEQAETNAKGHIPVVIMRSNRKEALVVIKLSDWKF